MIAHNMSIHISFLDESSAADVTRIRFELEMDTIDMTDKVFPFDELFAVLTLYFALAPASC